MGHRVETTAGKAQGETLVLRAGGRTGVCSRGEGTRGRRVGFEKSERKNVLGTPV